ncbi:MAG: hypothetical protein V3V08_10465 [Nannocystaceae bacterium]
MTHPVPCSFRAASRRCSLLFLVCGCLPGAPPDTGGPAGGGPYPPQTPSDDDGTTDGEGGDPETCEPSGPAPQGAFYRRGIPTRQHLDTYGHAGVPIVLRGRVRNIDCEPIFNARVEIWHATPTRAGASPGDTNAVYDTSAEFAYYGRTATDTDGVFTFITLKPGWYLSESGYRPAHIHAKVWVGGHLVDAQLTTQIFFEDDPLNSSYPWFGTGMVARMDNLGVATKDLVVDF